MKSILVWNVRGAANDDCHRHLQDLVGLHKPNIVALLEPKISGHRAHRVIESRGFSRSIRVEAEDFSGGIWLLWNEEEVQITLLSSGKQVINVLVHEDPIWLLSIIYASPQRATRELLWKAFAEVLPTHEYPWLVMGDFNQIESIDDKMGGSQTYTRDMEAFASWMECCGLVDMGFSGPRFTWSDSWDTGRRLMKRLDRAYANTTWRLVFPEALAINLPRRSSDHLPLLMKFEDRGGATYSRENRFKFEAAWQNHSDFKHCLAESWDTNANSWQENIKSCSDSISLWARTVFQSIIRRKKRIQARLNGIQKRLELGWNGYLVKLEKDLRLEFDDILREEELYWRQRYKGQFIVHGERNTRFFHLSTILRRGKNRIIGLIDSDGVWIDDEGKCLYLAREHFRDLFSCDNNFQGANFTPASFRTCPIALQKLADDLTDDEISEAVHQMGSFKTPGPDGFSPIFYQQNWNVVGSLVCSMVRTAFISNELPRDINHTLIRLIPKVSNPERIVDFRPISLLNVSLKIITRVLVNRLRPMMDDLIAPTQASFLPGRGTTDNILLVQEVMHSFKLKHGSSGYMAIKVDLSKAYDRLSWSSIKDMLCSIGLPDDRVTLIMNIVSSASFQILWNNTSSEVFYPTRGLRQGDSLSPYLFNLCIERLSQLIFKATTEGVWRSIKASRSGPKISHVFFADDLMFFAEAFVEQMKTIMGLFTRFGQESEQVINWEKSSIYFSPNTCPNTQFAIGRESGIPITTDLGRYLGAPIIHT
ncbi:hypothetical protein vseg_017686 [Gypsophila vaccaria]